MNQGISNNNSSNNIVKMEKKAIPNKNDIDFIIYHKSCPDGWASFMICYRYLKALGNDAHNRLKTYPMSHKYKILPDVTGANLLIADFSIKREYYLELYSKAKTIILLDHHESSVDAIMDLPNTVIDQQYSGAILTWKFFHGDVNPNDVYLDIQDRDLWKWEREWNKQISLTCRCRLTFEETEENIEAWSNYIDNPDIRENFKEAGKKMEELQMYLIREKAKYAKQYIFFGYTTLMCEATEFQSEIGDFILKTRKCDIVMIWSMDDYNNVYSIKLRSKVGSEVNVEQIAKKFGGGGHIDAAAFTFSNDYPLHQIFTRAKEIYDIESAVAQIMNDDMFQ